MKILFLDIDGVINSERSCLAGAFRMKDWSEENDAYFMRWTKATIDPVACGLVNRLLREFDDLFIVLSSSHRQNFRETPEKRSEIKAYLSDLGVDGDRCIDYTPYMNSIRGIQIQDWLNRHPEVTHYVILDDSSDMMEEQLQNFVRTNPDIGFSAYDYRRASKLLGGNPSEIISP